MINVKQPLLLSQNNVTSLFTSSTAGTLHSGAASRVVVARRRVGRSAHRLPRISCSSTEEAIGTSASITDKLVTVKAVVTAQRPIGGIYATRGLDDIGDLFGKTLLLEIVSEDVDSRTMQEKAAVSAYAHKTGKEGRYEATFSVPSSFGPVGALLIENEHHKEMFIKDVVLITGDDDSTAVTFDCNSWVHSKFDSPTKRVFFSVKSYLPSQTPKGLERLRNRELEALRGDGRGERKAFERIYDYDVYNDLGDPDRNAELRRPVLGGAAHQYPRRCRTGRPRARQDPSSEQRSSTVYVPRDEQFSEVKGLTFGATTLRSGLHAVIPALEPLLIKQELRFPTFPAIDGLYSDGIPLPGQKGFELFRSIIPRVVKFIEDTTEHVLRFETPAMVERDRFSWYRDEEFARQTLAGLNPICIQLVTEFPIVSKLDPAEYGPPESLLTKELIEKQMKGVMTVEEAVRQKKLFMLDYHDVFLPYVHKVRELQETTLYGSRTLFFLTEEGTLLPLAIELTRPKSPTKPQWKRVFTHGPDATSSWLWKLAKAHVLTHDTGYHQLVSHWLRTHCCVEPYIIAANRQLSRMHPIYRLLHPHFRYTMEINGLARESLINAAGIIESSFWPGRYSVELSSVAYDKTWQFDTEALPNDLIKRGMAVEENGKLKLTIEDYPYANDGLLVWNSIKEWATDYVNFYYKSASDIVADEELQAWWEEVRTKGHADKKDEPWWPVLDCKENLVQILTTIMWVTSGHHAAVNFGQYHFAGYFPNRPTIIRKPVPVEENHEHDMKNFLNKPEEMLLESLPAQMQAIKVMTTLDILSTHSPDEEYMGEYAEPSWLAEPMINAAFEKFSGRMREIEGTVDERNSNPELKNRCGAGVVPYELLKPFSKPGVTGRGIPNSISI